MRSARRSLRPLSVPWRRVRGEPRGAGPHPESSSEDRPRPGRTRHRKPVDSRLVQRRRSARGGMDITGGRHRLLRRSRRGQVQRGRWCDRLVPYDRVDARPSRAMCLDAHHLVVSILVANREKDVRFAGPMAGWSRGRSRNRRFGFERGLKGWAGMASLHPGSLNQPGSAYESNSDSKGSRSMQQCLLTTDCGIRALGSRISMHRWSLLGVSPNQSELPVDSHRSNSSQKPLRSATRASYPIWSPGLSPRWWELEVRSRASIWYGTDGRRASRISARSESLANPIHLPAN